MGIMLSACQVHSSLRTVCYMCVSLAWGGLVTTRSYHRDCVLKRGTAVLPPSQVWHTRAAEAVAAATAARPDPFMLCYDREVGRQQ